MSKDTSGPAFPVAPVHQQGYSHTGSWGLTKREYFAGLAMQGMMANNWNQNYESWAEHAFKLADAMIAEGSK